MSNIGCLIEGLEVGQVVNVRYVEDPTFVVQEVIVRINSETAETAETAKGTLLSDDTVSDVEPTFLILEKGQYETETISHFDLDLLD